MPKPQGTYLQTQKINKIALRAQRSRETLNVHAADIKRAHLRKLDLRAARNIAYLAHELGPEPTNRADLARRALGELVDHLGDMKDQIDKISETFAEIREPHFEFRAVTHGQQVITASNVLVIAMATITLLMCLEKAISSRNSRRT